MVNVNTVSVDELELLLSRLFEPRYAKQYLDIKKVDRDLTKIGSEVRTLIDVGAGLCIDLLHLASRHRIYGIAVDLSKQNLAIGRSWAKRLGIDNKMDFVTADALNLPFRDGSVDAVVSYSSIEHLPKRELACKWINEMARVVRKGGTFVLTTSNKLWPIYTLIWLSRRFKVGLVSSWNTNEFFFHPYEVRNMTENAGLHPLAFDGRVLYYYSILPNFPLAKYMNFAIRMVINSFQNLSLFKIICGRIGFRAVKT